MSTRIFEYTNSTEDAYSTWAVDGNKNVITPSKNKEELDEKMAKFNSMPYDNRLRADEESIRLFGKTNKERYEEFNSKFLKKNDVELSSDIDDNSVTTTESADIHIAPYTDVEVRSAEDWSNLSSKTIIIPVNSLDKLEELWNKFNSMIRKHQRESDWKSLELFGCTNETHYNKLKSVFLKKDIPDSDLIDKNITVATTEQSYIERKYNYLNSLNINEDYDYIKESIDELSFLNKSLFEEALMFNLINKLSEKNDDMDSGEFVDLTEAVKLSNNDKVEYQYKKKTKNSLNPVYIVLVEGTSAFSNAIKKVTNGIYSHSALSFDESLTRMYSYNLKTKFGHSGLSIESIDDYNKNSKLGVFAIFVKESEYDKLKRTVDYYLDNEDKTSYSINNVFSMLFNIPLHRDFKMVCSQFVDNLLKVINIDITNKDSSLVSPNDFDKARKKNKKIYKLYAGKVHRYNRIKVQNFINDLINKGPKYINESYNTNIIDLQPCFEAVDFPVQFNKDGDLFIKKIKKVNNVKFYDAEFAKCHKLLLQYEKSNNIEGMKYELSKLWYMNTKLEYYINQNEINKRTFTSVRALILNDFNKYLNVVLSNDNTFNFTEYYEASPFSDDTVKVSKNTLKYTIDLVKNIIR